MEGLAKVVGLGEALPAFDAYVPCMSLPYRFGTTVETVPADVPYLRATPADAARWGERLRAKAGARRRIAFAWAGKATHLRDRFRSMRLSQWPSLFSGGDAAWFSVQKGPGREQLREIAEAENVVDLSEEIGDFGDTTAILSQMDLVVTVDTAVAHLAGALNVPTWVLLPFSPDCRWLLEREDTPWYPSMRLFRQDKPGNWGAVIERVRAELAKIFAE
jgi:hypothetical protein